MRVGMVGLGKLGYPVALAMASQGHEVLGYDVDPEKMDHEQYKEGGRPVIFKAGGDFMYSTLASICGGCEIIFVAVQTPHDPDYEGVKPMLDADPPYPARDFDYSYLVEAVKEILRLSIQADTRPVVAIISTVMPGTIRRLILPWVKDRLEIVYNPSFIAMGTTIKDFLEPEFVLLGSTSPVGLKKVRRFYQSFLLAHKHQIRCHTLEEAELLKVAYNTFIGLKIVYANTLMEICHKLNAWGTVANIDSITNTLGLADKRLISTKYLRGGMGDGGGCHPRDNIAMRRLSNKLRISYDLFGAVMEARERQARFLATEMILYCQKNNLPPVILGQSFKPEVDDPTGSAAVLVENILKDWGYTVWRGLGPLRPQGKSYPGVILIGCNKPGYAKVKFPRGSVVIDPWRYIPDQDGVKVVRVGG